MLYNSTAATGIFVRNLVSYWGLAEATVSAWVSFVSQLYANGTPIIIQYELYEEVIEPYTEEQQEQYNKIKELYTFNGTTNISSDDEVPPYLQIQYYMKGE